MYRTLMIFTLLSLIWGSTWMAIKINLQAFPPFLSAGARFLLAGALLFLLLKARKMALPREWRILRPGVIFGVLNGLSYGLVYWGEQHISSSLTAISNAVLPFFSLIFAWLMVGEKITRWKVAGLIAGFTGMLVIFGDNISAGGSTGGSPGGRYAVLGQLAVMVASVNFAFAGAHAKKHHQLLDPHRVVTVQMLASAAVLLVLGAVLEYGHPVGFSVPALLAFLYLSLIGTALAFYMYNYLLQKMEVSRLGYISFVTPVIAAIFGAWLMDERLSLKLLAGMIFITCGIILLNRPGRKGGKPLPEQGDILSGSGVSRSEPDRAVILSGIVKEVADIEKTERG